MTPQELLEAARENVREVTTDDAHSHYSQWHAVIDVREANEYAQGRLPGARLIPRGVLELHIEGTEDCKDKEAPYLLYCRSGRRSLLAGEQLRKMGYTHVVSMAGGFLKWHSEGKPFEEG